MLLCFQLQNLRPIPPPPRPHLLSCCLKSAAWCDSQDALFAGFYVTLPSLDAEADISKVYARVAQAVNLLLLLISHDLMHSCDAIIMESEAAMDAMATMSSKEVAPMVAKGDY